ncbi:DUF3253 domain-containing protein [Cecembia rubra]|uniref:DUF3253 domain-containing protein n=1 Tax=Cecembia rubra TaxID=1485585 RepID=UPI002714A2F7|nr:DUF3253 domain-containing protein [Cecembia rubra]
MKMEEKAENILEMAILEMGRMRKGGTFCPSEVVRWMYPQDWRFFMDDVKEVMMKLYREGKITVFQKNNPVDIHSIPKGPVRIKLK